MQWLKIFDRLILTTIIHYQHLCINIGTSTLHRTEALMQEVLYIEIDYDDG
jgi:hypothetical protein